MPSILAVLSIGLKRWSQCPLILTNVHLNRAISCHLNEDGILVVFGKEDESNERKNSKAYRVALG